MDEVTTQLEISSLQWFSYEVRAAALRLLAAGTSDGLAVVVDETMRHPRLHEILHCLALFGHGAVREYHGCVSPRVAETFGVELGVAADLALGTMPEQWGADADEESGR